MKITAETNVADALKMSRKVSDVFRKYDLKCLNCKGIVEESVAKIAFNTGIDINEFLNDLNNALD